MTRVTILSSALAIAFILASFTSTSKFVSSKTHIKFFSTTAAEDIESNNYKSVSTIVPVTGDVVFSVPMQSFEFEKALMQKHFNGKDFLDTKEFPKAKLKGKITNISDINFEKDGTYNANIEGELTIKGETNTVHEKGTITVEGALIKVNSKFNITLADYGISFAKGKPSTNVAKTVEVTVVAEYNAQ